MRMPARKPRKAETIDSVITTARPNNTSDALLREAVRMAATVLCFDFGCMVPAAIWHLESCDHVTSRGCSARQYGECGVNRGMIPKKGHRFPAFAKPASAGEGKVG